MKKIMKGLAIIVLIGTMVFFSGCQSNSIPAEGNFTVEFVDYDGTVLKSITCDSNIPCEITPPQENPDNKENSYFTRWSVFPEDYDQISSDTTIQAIYTLDNRVVTIFGRSIVFYSFFIMTGIVVALVLGLRESKRHQIKQDDLIDGFLWIVPVAILGARLWYVVFELGQFTGFGFFPSLMRMIGFEYGTEELANKIVGFGLSGLAIHGAFSTAVLCAYFYTKKRKMDIFVILDLMAVGFIIAQAFGRWGNFYNQEAHGYIVGGSTDGVMNLTLQEQYNYLRFHLHIPRFIVDNMYIMKGLGGFSVAPFTGFYHPTFFYESTLNVLGFAIMLVLRRVKQIHFGELFAFYLVWYGSVRIFIETMRTDPLVFELFGVTFKSAIVTSGFMIVGGILMSVLIRLRRKGKTYGTVPGYFGYVKPTPEMETIND